MLSPLTCMQNFLPLCSMVFFCLYSLILSQYLFSLHFFLNIILIIFSIGIFSLICCCPVFCSFYSIVFLCIFSSAGIFIVLVVSLFVLLASFHIQLLYICLASLAGGGSTNYHYLSPCESPTPV